MSCRTERHICQMGGAEYKVAVTKPQARVALHNKARLVSETVVQTVASQRSQARERGRAMGCS